MKIYIYILSVLILLASPGLSWAEEADNTPVADEAGTEVQDESADTYEYEEPGDYAEPQPVQYELAPEVSTWLGYRFTDVSGSKRAAEYLWPHPSATGGMLLHYSPLPHRTDFELDWVNHHDYEAEADYAYRDIFRLDYRGWSLFHNLDHYNPQNIPPANHLNLGTDYSVTARSNKVSLRLKWPDRAFHAFASYRQYDREGTIQQRFRTTGKFSKSRDIDWTTRDIIAGINGHFGPIEAEYSHRIKKLDVGGVTSFTDNFTGGLGVAVHNVVSERTTNTDTVKLHTDLTGRVAGSVTLVNGDKKNEYSRSYVDFRRAAGDLVFIPLPNLTVAMKYRFSELQTDAQETFGRYNSGVAPAQDPIDSRTNSAEMNIRYSPATNFSLKGGYKFTNTRRYGTGVWNDETPDVLVFQDIPPDQDKHDLTLSAMVRPVKNVTARGSLGYTYTHDPAYPVSARNSYKGKFGVTWTPAYSVSANAYYNFVREDNGATDMDSRKDNAGLSASWAPGGSLTVNGGYDYFRYRNDRDLQLRLGADPPTVYGSALQDTAHVYYIGAGYRFAIPLSLNAEFHQSWSKDRYRVNGANSTGTVTTDGIGDLTDVKVRETGGTVKAAYDLSKGWGTSVEYTVNDYQDLEDKPQNGFQDGLAQTVIVMLSKNW